MRQTLLAMILSPLLLLASMPVHAQFIVEPTLPFDPTIGATPLNDADQDGLTPQLEDADGPGILGSLNLAITVVNLLPTKGTIVIPTSGIITPNSATPPAVFPAITNSANIEGAPGAEVVVDLAGFPGSGLTINVPGGTVFLSNLTFENVLAGPPNTAAISIIAGDVRVVNCRIRRLFNGAGGILVAGSYSRLVVSGCDIAEGAFGVQVTDGATAEIDRSNISCNDDGVVLLGAHTYAEIRRTAVSYNNDDGVYIGEDAKAAMFDDDISYNGGDAIENHTVEVIGPPYVGPFGLNHSKLTFNGGFAINDQSVPGLAGLYPGCNYANNSFLFNSGVMGQHFGPLPPIFSCDGTPGHNTVAR